MSPVQFLFVIDLFAVIGILHILGKIRGLRAEESLMNRAGMIAQIEEIKLEILKEES